MDIQRALPTLRTARHGLVLLVALAATCGLSMLTAPARAAAEVTCPNANPIVNENNCMGAGTTSNERVPRLLAKKRTL